MSGNNQCIRLAIPLVAVVCAGCVLLPLMSSRDQGSGIERVYDESTTTNLAEDESERVYDAATTSNLTGDELMNVYDEVTTSNLPEDEPGLRAKHIYVLSNTFTGQQGSALSGLVTLQCWMKLFFSPVYVVEPFIKDSVIHGTPGDKRLRFSDFFDIDAYNKISVEDGYAEIAAWEDFIKNTPRNVVLVVLTIKRSKTKVSWNSHKCNDRFETAVELSQYGFCVVRVVEAYLDKKTEQILTTDEMERIVWRDWGPNNSTLVFSKWSWHWLIGKNTERNAICRNAREVGLLDKLHPGKGLLKSAIDYEEQIFASERSNPFHVAIMLRIERVVLRQANKVPLAKECMQKVVSLVRNLQEGRDRQRPYVTLDLAKFGSNSVSSSGINPTLWSQLTAIVRNGLRSLAGREATLDFDVAPKTITGGITDHGYVAAVQRTIASRADCLVLVGGGNFLKLALGDYLNFHPNPSSWCIHTVCMGKTTARGEEFQQRYNHIMDAARNLSQSI